MSVVKAIIEGGKQIFKRSKPKKTFSKNIGIGKIKQEGLYKNIGKDKYGDNIANGVYLYTLKALKNGNTVSRIGKIAKYQ